MEDEFVDRSRYRAMVMFRHITVIHRFHSIYRIDQSDICCQKSFGLT